MRYPAGTRQMWVRLDPATVDALQRLAARASAAAGVTVSCAQLMRAVLEREVAEAPPEPAVYLPSRPRSGGDGAS